jgi:site-specific recombinase XerD
MSKVPLERLIPNPKLKFMEQCREVMRFRRLALRTEQAYRMWARRFSEWLEKRRGMSVLAAGEMELRDFLSDLAT